MAPRAWARLRFLSAHITPSTCAAVPPLDSAAALWPVAASAGLPLFNEFTFNATAFERDGCAVFPGIMTANTQARWREACRAVQALNDRLLAMTDWAGVDWAAAGLQRPDRLPTPDDLAKAKGGSQLVGPPFKPVGYSAFLHRELRGFAFGWGGFPEHTAVEYHLCVDLASCEGISTRGQTV
jgi:hypothetical protein